jgi:hypothetical protein
MAKAAAGPGIYRPLSRRARKLISQLGHATHASVQNAYIQEIIHEIEKGSRRVRKAGAQGAKAGSWLSGQIRAALLKAAKRGGAAVRKAAGNLHHALRYGARLECSHPQCKGQQFRNRLQFGAHARGHQREAAARPQGRQGAKALTERQRARLHAADHISAAGRQGRAAQAAARKATAAGRPLGGKDLKAMARGVTAARNTPPSPSSRPAGGAVNPARLREARQVKQTPRTRAAMREAAVNRREMRAAHRAYKALPAGTPARFAAQERLLAAMRKPSLAQGYPRTRDLSTGWGTGLRSAPSPRATGAAAPARTPRPAPARTPAAPRSAPARTAPAAPARPGRS